jgi:hypothetical protein
MPAVGDRFEGVILVGTRWVKVEATIVECFRAWEEPVRSAHAWFEIVADVKISTGEVQRVTSQQKLNTRTHHWRPPDPGDVVRASWDPAGRKLRLDLGGDARFDEKLIKKLGRSRDAGSWPPTGFGGIG